jgi:hypothetical protein
MRKYLVATAIGAMLLAGQAAASESSVINTGDRINADSEAGSMFAGNGGAFLGLGAALLIGLVAWGLTQGHSGGGRPVSP